MRRGQLLAGVGGVLLFIFLFLPWFDTGTDTLSGWQGQSSTDVYLLITAVVAVWALVAGGGAILPGLRMNGASALLGGVGTILLIWLTLFDFPEGQDRKIGLYLSLVAVAIIAFGGYTASQHEAGSSRRDLG